MLRLWGLELQPSLWALRLLGRHKKIHKRVHEEVFKASAVRVTGSWRGLSVGPEQSGGQG